MRSRTRFMVCKATRQVLVAVDEHLFKHGDFAGTMTQLSDALGSSIPVIRASRLSAIIRENQEFFQDHGIGITFVRTPDHARRRVVYLVCDKLRQRIAYSREKTLLDYIQAGSEGLSSVMDSYKERTRKKNNKAKFKEKMKMDQESQEISHKIDEEVGINEISASVNPTDADESLKDRINEGGVTVHREKFKKLASVFTSILKAEEEGHLEGFQGTMTSLGVVLGFEKVAPRVLSSCVRDVIPFLDGVGIKITFEQKEYRNVLITTTAIRKAQVAAIQKFWKEESFTSEELAAILNMPLGELREEYFHVFKRPLPDRVSKKQAKYLKDVVDTQRVARQAME